MDKTILQDYIDACELIKETEKDIQRLNQKKKTIIQTNVKGSMHEFPYVEQHFKVRGTTFSVKDDSRLRYEERLLEQRKANAEQIKLQVEEWMLTLPPRMQRIVKYRYLEGLAWEKVAIKMGRKATADSVRKEFERFSEEK
ncbi:RNA polymerase subunit sigma-70 [Acetatifactor muris]|uniref:RNA polymerase subunit sigma-70 n=1 Tax=Acetatifactor muris TaxID=879566 RepID=UPI0023F38000|nr:RNA polymerase subunit sigma-70 [Acetatifactor muris]